MPDNTCRTWLTATLATAPAKARKRFARAAVLGDALGFTVELQDATQFYVGRQHCKYCARAEALMQLSRDYDPPKPKADSPELTLLRILCRYQTHGGYVWCAVMDDTECMCVPCVRANYRQIFRATADVHDHSGWRLIALDHSGASDTSEHCANCGKLIWSKPE